MIREKLTLEYTQLNKQRDWLAYSLQECQTIGIRPTYTIDEFGLFETLCSRYARGVDFLIRKVFRTIDAYEFENQGTLIDTVNNAEKRGLISDVETLRTMKDIRNTLVHEYIEEALSEVFDEVLEYTEILLEIMDATLAYIDKALQR